MKLTRSEAWEASFFGFPIEELKIGKSELSVDEVTAQLAELVDGVLSKCFFRNCSRDQVVSHKNRVSHNSNPWRSSHGMACN